MMETVAYCSFCRTKTWHFDGVCEWADGHKIPPVEPERMSDPGPKGPGTDAVNRIFLDRPKP
jgi:hypothetical protein